MATGPDTISDGGPACLDPDELRHALAPHRRRWWALRGLDERLAVLLDEAASRFDRAERWSAEVLGHRPAAEAARQRASRFPVGRGPLREALLAVRADALDDVASCDSLLAEVARARQVAVGVVRQVDATLRGTPGPPDARRALAAERGTGPRGRAYVGRGYWGAHRATTVATSPPTEATDAIGGRALRDVLIDLLAHDASDAGLTIPELVAVLAAHGLRPTGSRPERTVSNELGRAVAAGLVERVERGCYRWSGPRRDDPDTDAGGDPTPPAG